MDDFEITDTTGEDELSEEELLRQQQAHHIRLMKDLRKKGATKIDKPPPKKRQMAKVKQSSSPKLPKKQKPSSPQRELRLAISPYLPPPVVSAMGDLDPLLEPYVGPEASITLMSTVIFALLIVNMMRVLSTLLGGSGRAIVNDDDDAMKAIGKGQDFGDTVILVGPTSSGKTRIFYKLIHDKADLPTVMSVRANAALLHNEDDNGKASSKPVRVMDYPGYASLDDSLFLDILKCRPRIVLVIDSNAAVAPAADLLYDLLQHCYDQTWKSSFPLFIACHKCDLSMSKNPRRLKIMLRTELERLLVSRSKSSSSTGGESKQTSWWPAGEPLDLDNLTNVTLHLEATSCNSTDGIDHLIEFCRTGTIA